MNQQPQATLAWQINVTSGPLLPAPENQPAQEPPQALPQASSEKDPELPKEIAKLAVEVDLATRSLQDHTETMFDVAKTLQEATTKLADIEKQLCSVVHAVQVIAIQIDTLEKTQKALQLRLELKCEVRENASTNVE